MFEIAGPTKFTVDNRLRALLTLGFVEREAGIANWAERAAAARRDYEWMKANVESAITWSRYEEELAKLERGDL
jgi:hypothetical protein